MTIRKNPLRSDVGRELWEKYFGFLAEKKQEERPLFSVRTNVRPEAGAPSSARVAVTSANSRGNILEEISSQFNGGAQTQVVGHDGLETQLEAPSSPSAPASTTAGLQDGRLTTSDCNLYDVARYFKNRGVVGEESLAVAITLALINNASFGVEGYSGSGKTFITDKLMDLVEDRAYRIGQSSKLAVFGDADKINGCRVIYIPELQKAMKQRNSPIIEVIKDLTEGKDATRVVTKRGGKGTEEYRIKSGVSIVYTLALENYFKKDEESSRRLIRFRTDPSPEHLEEIHGDKARKRHALDASEKSRVSLERKLKRHVYECMDMDGVKVIDPFAEYISSLIPRTQKSVGYVDHYYSLLDACAKFHANNRTQVDVDGQTYLLIEVQDHITVFRAYFGEFIKTLKEFSQRKDQAQELEPGEENSELDYFEHIPEPDWAQCYRKGLEVISTDPALSPLMEDYGDKVAEWLGRQVKDDKIFVLDYSTGKQTFVADLSQAVTPTEKPLFGEVNQNE